MKVYSKIVIDIETGEVVNEVVYNPDYHGPVALCNGGSGGGSSGGFDPYDPESESYATGGTATTGGDQETKMYLKSTPTYIIPPEKQQTTSIADAAKQGLKAGGIYGGILAGGAATLDALVNNYDYHPDQVATQAVPGEGGAITEQASTPAAAATTPKTETKAEADLSNDLVTGQVETTAAAADTGTPASPLLDEEEERRNILLTALEDEEELRRRRLGRQQTILTGGLGLTDQPRIKQRTLLGA